MRRESTPVLALAMFFAFITAFSAFAESTDSSNVETKILPELRAYRVNPHPPDIDGNLDDDVWKNSEIEKSSNFTQQAPNEGETPAESTVVAVAYDDNALYVAFWCYDSEPDKIARQLVRRDRSSQADQVSVCIDASHDHQSCYRFLLNASGVQQDIRYYNNDNSDVSWDAVWTSASKIQPWGWSAEFKIPYHCLRFAEKEEHIWGFNFTRSINRSGEYDKWAFVPLKEGGFVSNFGHLKNIRNIKPAGHLELMPYAVSSMEYEPKSMENSDGRKFKKNIGFDMKYGLSTDLILDAAINPDFGQVELDQPVLDLSAYETFFSERRPFFLEGADLFNTDFMLFYSRRIGRPPYRNVNDDSLEYYTEYPSATTILGAAKLSGKVAERTSIAFLNATTEEETAEYASINNEVYDSTYNDVLGEYEKYVVSADTVYGEGVVEPLANYSVFRIKQGLFKYSHLGAMFTLVSQETVNPIITGGADWRLVANNNSWGFRGQAVFSRVDNENIGFGFDATIEKLSGKHIRGAFGFTFKNPDLKLNRIGYTSRVDTKHVWGWLEYRTTDDWWIIRDSYNNFNYYQSWNYDGINYQLGGNFNTYIEFTNFWSLGGGFNFQAERYSDLETRGNGLWEWPVHPTYSWWMSLNTDARKKLWFNYNPGSGGDRGGWWAANYFGVFYRPKSNMTLSAGMNYCIYRDILRWVSNEDAYNPISGTEETMSLFGVLNQDLIYVEASASIVLKQNLSIQLSAECLVSGLDYDNYLYYVGGNDYVAPEDEQGNTVEYNVDYNYSAINSMLLMRWEYLPGSSLYLVWTRSRPEVDDTINNLNLSRDFKRMFSGDAQNIFLIKTSYWMNI
ncbi:MAG: DUF5916 domain-containing protein [Candidatus Zixiibacteriota bacterium]